MIGRAFDNNVVDMIVEQEGFPGLVRELWKGWLKHERMKAIETTCLIP